MNTIRFACPNCGQHLSCDAASKGMQVQCPACAMGVLVPNVMVGVPLPQNPPVAAPPVMSETQSPTMPATTGQAELSRIPLSPSPQRNDTKPRLAWLCDNCGSEFSAPYDDFGKTIECSVCHQATRIYKPAKKSQESPAPTAEASPVERKTDRAARVGLVFGALCLLSSVYYFNTKAMVAGFFALLQTILFFVGGFLLTRTKSTQLQTVLLGLLAVQTLAAFIWCFVAAIQNPEEIAVFVLLGTVFAFYFCFTLIALIGVAKSGTSVEHVPTGKASHKNRPPV